MAKEVKKYLFPSRFGSHKIMVNETETVKLASENKIVLTDEYGDYVTDKNRLDSGLADPNRCHSKRLERLFDKKPEDNKE